MTYEDRTDWIQRCLSPADVAVSDIRAKSVGSTAGYPEILLKSIKISTLV